MNLRTAIRDMLTSGDATGLGDVPADEVAQALTNYADTAPLAEADALAPIVTRASHVPFDADIDGPLGTPLDDIHADLASLDPVDMGELDDGGDALDPGDGIDDEPVGNGHAADEAETGAEPAADDDADATDSADVDSDVDPDGWFETIPGEATEAPNSFDSLPANDASNGDDAMAFGTGTTESIDDADHQIEPDVYDTLSDPVPTFEDATPGDDVINELPVDEPGFDPGLVADEVEVDDVPDDDAFGDVDFDL